MIKALHKRNRTDEHIPVTLIGYLKVKANEVLHTDKKVELKLDRGTIKLEPLFLKFNTLVAIAEQLNLYMTREEIQKLENDIKEGEKTAKDLALALSKLGSSPELKDVLEKVKSGEMSIDELHEFVSNIPVEETKDESSD